jgi:peptidyl-prolyl cis-trans isomerase B (cyclophilin B)
MKKFMLIAICAGMFAGCQSKGPSTMELIDDYEKEATEPKIEEVEAGEKQVVAEPAPEPATPERTTAMILMKTSKGDIKIELNKEKAPKTVENFLKYVEAGHYTGTIFHRVIDGFMIQGGGFDENMAQKPAPYTVENEADNGLANNTGTIAMARTQDPHSGGAQFFINVKDNDFLNHRAKNMQGWGYCVFGEVVEGMDVVNEIKTVSTGRAGPHSDVPTELVIIEEVVIVEG